MKIKIKDLYIEKTKTDESFTLDLIAIDEDGKEYLVLCPGKDGHAMKIVLYPKSFYSNP